MAPGRMLVVNSLGAAELDELEDDDTDNPDSLSVLDPEKARYVAPPFAAPSTPYSPHIPP